jgi:hypothetical protein
MKLSVRGRIAIWTLVAALLVAGHAGLLAYVSSHLALSAAMVVVGLLLASHLGLLGRLRAILKRRPPRG